MPWRGDEPGLGFSAAAPWLPVGPDHADLAVDRQEADAGSMLHWTRAVLALRRAHPALRIGSVTMREVGAAMLVFERQQGGERLLCVFNLGIGKIDGSPAEPDAWRPVATVNDVNGWTLGRYAGLVAERTPS